MSDPNSSTILIVDDQPANRLTLEALLAVENYQLLSAESGDEALRMLQAYTIDLVLLDIMMPGLDGYQVCRTIRSTPRLEELPVVMVTALNDQESRLKGIEAGADDFISKPFDKGELRARVKTIARLNRYRKLVDQSHRVEFLESHDPVTGLPNRSLLAKQLAFAIEAAEGVAVICVGFDKITEFRDTLGAEATDKLLWQLTGQLKDGLGRAHSAARLGEDQFAVLYSVTESSGGDVAPFARQLAERLEQPLDFAGQPVRTPVSIGLSLYPADGEDAGGLIDKAVAALAQARETAPGSQMFFAPRMNDESRRRLQLENELREALEGDELYLLYQPKVDFKKGSMAGAEALARWRHPDRGVVMPGEFIPLAEKTGLIHKLGDKVLDMACRQLASWQQAGLPPSRVSVNVSALQFEDEDFVSKIEGYIEGTGVAPEMLELELTESILMPSGPGEIDAIISTLHSLKSLGVYLSIDDFGSGYSSLSYLARFPVDALKIDRRFVTDMFCSINNATITKAVIDLAHNLQLKVVAAGVENEAQREFLHGWQCDEGQGFLFYEPLPVADVEAILRDYQGLVFPVFEACANND